MSVDSLASAAPGAGRPNHVGSGRPFLIDQVPAAIPRVRTTGLSIARHDGGKAPLRELKRLAERRHTPLVLLPSIPDLTSGDPNQALEAAQVPLQAILGALAR